MYSTDKIANRLKYGAVSGLESFEFSGSEKILGLKYPSSFSSSINSKARSIVNGAVYAAKNSSKFYA